MTEEEHLDFLNFLEKRRSKTSAPSIKALYSDIKNQYIKYHSKNLRVIDIDFKLKKDIQTGDRKLSKGIIFQSFGGLVSGIRDHSFTEKDYFEPVNIEYQIINQ